MADKHVLETAAEMKGDDDQVHLRGRALWQMHLVSPMATALDLLNPLHITISKPDTDYFS